jgi:hypothetical protein
MTLHRRCRCCAGRQSEFWRPLARKPSFSRADRCATRKMNRQERLERVALLCCHFMRNLAYYKAGWNDERFAIPKSEFNKTVNSNFIDICILEWCKLFGEHKEPHHWKNIVTDKARFQSGLLNCLETDHKGLEHYWNAVRTYRDTFIAHLDSDNTMHIPKMDWAHKSVQYYFEEIIEEYRTRPMHQEIPHNIIAYYQDRLNEAKVVYEKLSQPI